MTVEEIKQGRAQLSNDMKIMRDQISRKRAQITALFKELEELSIEIRQKTERLNAKQQEYEALGQQWREIIK